MAKFKNFASLADAFQAHEAANPVNPVGNRSYQMDHDTLSPIGVKKVQTPAQHAAVKKAASVSVRNRKLRAFGIMGTK